MNVQTWTYLFVFLSFSLYIGIAIWSRASSTKEFYVAGGGVPPLANGMATAADWMSAASFISMAGLNLVSRSRRHFLPDGLDRRLRSARPFASTLPAEVRQIHRARFYRRPLLFAVSATDCRVLCESLFPSCMSVGRCRGPASCFRAFLKST